MGTNTVEMALVAKDAASKAIQDVHRGVSELTNSLGRMMAMAGVGIGFGAVIKEAVEFNSKLEDSRSGIAGLILATSEFRNASGEAATAQEKLSAAFAVASDVQKKLLVDARATKASYGQLVEAFQTAYGPATGAGITNLDKLRQVTVQGAQAVAALGLDSRQLGQELRAIFTGEQGPANTMNRVLGITKEQLDQVRASGGDVADFLLQKLAPFAQVAGESMTNFSVVLSNAKDAMEQTLGEASTGLMGELKEALKAVSDAADDFVPVLKAGFDALGVVVSEAVGLLRDLGETFSAILGDAETDAKGFAQTLGVVFVAAVGYIRTGVVAAVEAITSPLDTLRTLVAGVFSLLSEAFRKLADVPLIGGQFEEAADALDGLAVNLTNSSSTWAASAERLGGAAASAGQAVEKYQDQIGTTAGISKRAGDGLHHVISGTKAQEEGAKRASRATEAYAKAMLGLREGAEKAVVSVLKLVGAETQAERIELGRQYDEAKKAIAEWAFATGKRVDEVAAALERWKVKAEFALADPFKKALPVATSYFDQVKEAVGAGAAAGTLDYLVEEAVRAGKEIGVTFEWTAQTAIEAGQGVQAGWLAVLDRIPRAAESAARAVQETWNSLVVALDDSLFAAMTGKWEDFGNILDGLVQNITRSVAGYFSDLVQRIVSGVSTLKEEWTNYVQMIKGRGAGAVGADAAMGGLLGYGMGSATGDKGTTIMSTFLGAVGGMIGGQLGALIGSLVGMLVGSFLRKEREYRIGEYKLPYGTAHYGAGTQEWRGYDSAGDWDYMDSGGGPRQRYWDIDLGPRSPQEPWDPDNPIRGIQQEMRAPLKKTMESWVSQMADIFGFVDPSMRAAMTKEFAEKVKAFMDVFDVRLHAGTDEELQSVVRDFFEKYLPNQFLAIVFGRTAALPDISGIQQFVGAEGRGGDPASAAGALWDPDAPIPRMLAGLGVTAARIEEIARMVGVEDPQEVMDYLRDLVTILIGFRDLGTELGKTASEVWAEFDAASKRRPVASFEEAASVLVGLAQDLSSYTGSEQREKAKELIALGAEYLRSQREALLALKQLAESLAANIHGLLAQMETALMTPEQRLARDREAVFGQTDWGPTVVSNWQARIYDATTPEEVAQVVAETLDAAKRLFDQMLADLQTAQAARSEIGDLIEEMSGGFTKVSMNATTVGESWVAVRDLQQRAADAAALSGREQIDAIRAVGKDARTLWEANQALIQRLATLARDITKSINQQVWEIDYGAMNPQDQATAVADRIAELRAKLATATDPGEVQALTQEIQGLISRYLGLFDENDPNAAAARDWAKQQLEEISALARKVIEGMTDALEDANEALLKVLEGLTPILDEAITGLEADIERLRDVVASIEEAMRGELTDMGNEIVEAGLAFAAAMEEATRLFAEVSEALGGALGEPDGAGATDGDAGKASEGLTDNLSRASGAAGDFAGTVDAATRALERFLGAIPDSASSSRTTGSGSRLTAATGGGMASYALSVAEARYRARGPAFGARLTGR